MAVTTGKNRWHFEDITTKSQTRKMIKGYQTKSTWIIFGLESSHLNLRLSINAQSCVILPKTRVFFRSFRDDSNWMRNSNMRPIITFFVWPPGFCCPVTTIWSTLYSSENFKQLHWGFGSNWPDISRWERRKKSADWYQGGSGPQLDIEKVRRIRKTADADAGVTEKRNNIGE